MTKDDLLRQLATVVKAARAENKRTVDLGTIVDLIVESHLDAPLPPDPDGIDTFGRDAGAVLNQHLSNGAAAVGQSIGLGRRPATEMPE